jgi:hypothetical protein
VRGLLALCVDMGKANAGKTLTPTLSRKRAREKKEGRTYPSTEIFHGAKTCQSAFFSTPLTHGIDQIGMFR